MVLCGIFLFDGVSWWLSVDIRFFGLVLCFCGEFDGGSGWL